MKRLTILVFVLALAAAVIRAQDAPKKNEKRCRDLSESSNIVGPDEILVNGKVCKKAMMTPASQVEAAQTSPAAGRTFVAQDSEYSKAGTQSEDPVRQRGIARSSLQTP